MKISIVLVTAVTLGGSIAKLICILCKRTLKKRSSVLKKQTPVAVNSESNLKRSTVSQFTPSSQWPTVGFDGQKRTDRALSKRGNGKMMKGQFAFNSLQQNELFLSFIGEWWTEKTIVTKTGHLGLSQTAHNWSFLPVLQGIKISKFSECEALCNTHRFVKLIIQKSYRVCIVWIGRTINCGMCR